MSKGKDMSNRSLNRRAFGQLCVKAVSTLGVLAGAATTPSRALALDAPASADSASNGRTVKFRDGVIATALGQGSAQLAQARHPRAQEEEALRTGLSLGMTLIDTAETYGDGKSETLIAGAIAGQRDRVFLVSKVQPGHATAGGMAHSCEASLTRLGTDHLDLYLLHWPVPAGKLPEVVAAFEDLRSAGKIRAWGVSNFTVGDMESLFSTPRGEHCATNQVPYNLGDRGAERDVLPWCQKHGMPIMAYSPLGGPGARILRNSSLARIGAVHNCSAAAVALAWALRSGNVIAIPESGSAAHVKENAVALSLTLTPEDLQTLDTAFPIASR
jgi:diketogulonate reductase-like aldo/keto reductase